MQRGETAHRQADDMGLVDPQMIEHRGDVVRRPGLGVFRHIVRHVRRRIAARGVGDRPVSLAEMPHLGFPGAVVAGEFMHEDDRRARTAFLVVQADAVIGGGKGICFSTERLWNLLDRRDPKVIRHAVVEHHCDDTIALRQSCVPDR